MKHILILDDDTTTCLMLKSWFVKEGFNVRMATTVEEAQCMVKENALDLILSDIRMPDVDGFSFLSWIKRYDPAVMVMMMTGFSDVKTAVDAMKSGAVDYIEKPIKPEILFEKVENAFRNYANNHDEYNPNISFSQLRTMEYDRLMEKIEDTIVTQKHILIIGQRGTGKSSLRKYIYKKADTQKEIVIVVDEVNNNDSDFLSAQFHAAKNGILSIKSFHNLSKTLQAQLIDFLLRQSLREYTRVIATSVLPVEQLKEKLLPKLFDLFHDNYVVLPALKGRSEDILFFMERFLKIANYELGKQITGFSAEMQTLFLKHEWKGNIQELKNTIIKAVLLTESGQITTDILSDLGWAPLFPKNSLEVSDNQLEALRKENYEQQKIKEALELSKGNKTLAASILNIDRKTLYNKIRLYGVEVN